MQKLISLALVCAATFSTAARANVLFRGDFETGNLKQWDVLQGLPERITVVSSPVRQGKYAGRFELHQGDYASSGCRNEMVRETPDLEGDERYYSWSTMFPADYPSSNSWQVFTQWHHSGPDGSPPIEFDVIGENVVFTDHGDHTLWHTPLVRGVWHDFVFHVRWSSGDGWVELWYDGVKVLGKTSVQTMFPNQVNYLKQGLYRDANIQPVAVVFHDGMTMGTTLADVAPQLAAPPPGAGSPDAGTGTADAGPASGGGASADGGTPGSTDGGTPASTDGGTPASTDGFGAPNPSVASASVGPGAPGGEAFPHGGCSSSGGVAPAALLVVLASALWRRRRTAQVH